MAKATKQKDEIQAEEQNELEALRAKVAQLEEEKKEREERELASGNSNLVKELQEIRKNNKSGAGKITYKDIHDHVNIPLYHTNGLHIGKVVGPIHPGNAEDVYLRFQAIGVRLSIYKPTAEQIERHKQSKEYKEALAKFERKRKLKNKSKKESEVERLTQEIAKLTGVPANRINKIKSPEEISGIGAEQ